MKIINKSNDIFKSKEFICDKYMFNIIYRNLNSPTLKLYSDEVNYIFCQGATHLPTWIWTKDGFDKSVVEELLCLIKENLSCEGCNKFTCKRELYDLLKDKINTDNYFEMGFLLCEKVIKPKECNAKFYLAREDDKNTLIQHCLDSHNEMNGVDKLSLEEAVNDIERLLKDEHLYVLKNNMGKIVSMAAYSIIDNQAKITHVYTPKEERNKGYAANVIYYLTKYLLEKGYVVLLYSDYRYSPSNKAYINVGYEDRGILINFGCFPN